ncbi:MAG: ATP-dependent DNA helicase Rep [Candidatus Solibacter sp.]|nr:ATP-dependent DNA helicase Rep [Candidatus Solibacter sp.]
MDFLSGLNPRQKEAVCHVDGPLLILAGAGSGKTRVITHRIAHLIEGKGVFGPSVLAVTFTNKAAGEMRERVAGLLSGRRGDAGPTVSTFHSFCVRLLRRDGSGLASIRAGFTRDFQIYDADDQVVLVKQIYKKLGLDDKFMQHRVALSRISHSKNRNEGPEDLLRAATDPKITRLAKVFELYQDELRRANALDFDDLLLEAVRLLRHDAEVRALWNRRIEFLMVDEYQDTNRSQYELMRLLSQSHDNVAVVGDEDQSIYGWRGADIRNILDFEKDYPAARTIKLERNYRSTKTILDAAGAVVSNNRARIGKWLETENAAGPLIGFYEAADGESEAVFIADTIDKLLRQDSTARVAVLYRTNFQSRQIEEALRRYNRPYIVVGGFSFYQRAEIKDALAYLKLLANPNDGVSMARIFNVPARGIGKTTVEQIESLARDRGLPLWAAAETACSGKLLGARAEASVGVFLRLIAEMREFLSSHGVHETLNELLERTGYRQMIATDAGVDSESKLGNLEELISAATEAHERGESLTDFLDHAALVSDADQMDDQARVSLLTMHNAKGLEFPAVFIAGMEEGLFPHSRSRESDSQLEEERRLCYVAMTRAERRLYLTCARSRRRYGGSPLEPCQRSRFLEEVPPALIEELHIRGRAGVLDLSGERAEVRDAARRNTYTGKTYNSLDHISQFFAGRGIQAPSLAPKPAPAADPAARTAPPAPPRAVPAAKPAISAARPPAGPKTGKRGFAAGAAVYHAKYGRGTVIRKEGDGDDAKITVSFANIGIKKLIAKFAQLKAEP